jgi:glycerol uptake facilitator-like aquaporin
MEVVGSFGLVFTVINGILFDQISTGVITHFTLALTLGLVVLAILYFLKGSHLNPGVTIAFAGSNQFPWKEVPVYLMAQIIGVFLASELLWYLFPSGSEMQNFIPEAVITFLLMPVILSIAKDAKETTIIAGIAIGSVIGLEIVFIEPLSVTTNISDEIPGHLQYLFIYIIGTILGTLIAIPVCYSIRNHD